MGAECVVCLEGTAAAAPQRFACSPGCRGAQAVCPECEPALRACVFCRRGAEPEKARDPSRHMQALAAATAVLSAALLICAAVALRLAGRRE